MKWNGVNWVNSSEPFPSDTTKADYNIRRKAGLHKPTIARDKVIYCRQWWRRQKQYGPEFCLFIWRTISHLKWADANKRHANSAARIWKSSQMSRTQRIYIVNARTFFCASTYEPAIFVRCASVNWLSSLSASSSCTASHINHLVHADCVHFSSRLAFPPWFFGVSEKNCQPNEQNKFDWCRRKHIQLPICFG